MSLYLDLSDETQLKTPKLAQPQSPNEAAAILQQQSLLSPFARLQPRSIAMPHTPGSSMLAGMPRSDHARHKLSALGPLPAALTAALRQRELQPQAEPCSFGCGTGGAVWAALGSTLFVWRAASPQGCRRLASPLPSEVGAADLVCEIQPGAGEEDTLLLLVCWSSRSSCRLALYEIAHLSQPPAALATPPPVAEVALSAASAPVLLRQTPGTVAPAPSAAAAVLGTGAALFAVAIEHGRSGGPAGYSLRASPLERGGSSLSSLFSSVTSYFGSAPRVPATCSLSHLTLAADWMATVSTAAGPTEASGADGAVLELWRRGGAGQLYEHAVSHQLGPVLGRALGSTAPPVVHVADVVALPAAEERLAKLLVLLATADSPTSPTLSLLVVELAISATGTVTPSAATPPALGGGGGAPPSIPCGMAGAPLADPVHIVASLRLVAAQRSSGPAVALRPTPSGAFTSTALIGGEAWAVRDVGGEPSSELIGKAGGGFLSAGSEGSGGLLEEVWGPLPDAKLLGAGGDEGGVLLIYSHQIVRVGAGAELTLRRRGTAEPFGRKVRDAFEQFVSAHRNGWDGATELGRSLEEEASMLRASGGSVASAVLEVSEALAKSSPLPSQLPSGAHTAMGASSLTAQLHTQIHTQLEAQLAQHGLLLRFARLHQLVDAASQPTEAAALIAHGEKLAAALTLRRLQNDATAANSKLLVAILEEVVRTVPGPPIVGQAAPSQALGGSAQDAFFGNVLLPGRWEALLGRLRVAAAAPVADDQRLSRVGFLCEAAAKPLAAARAYRTEVCGVLGHHAAPAGAPPSEAAEDAAMAAGVRLWTCEGDISDTPLLALGETAAAAITSMSAEAAQASANPNAHPHPHPNPTQP